MLLFPAMPGPALLKEFSSLGGGPKPAVSSTSLCLLKNHHPESPTHSSKGFPQQTVFSGADFQEFVEEGNSIKDKQ